MAALETDIKPTSSLPPTLREAMREGIKPSYRELNKIVTLVSRLDDKGRAATGEVAIYTDGDLNYHLTEQNHVFWGNNKIAQTIGIWGFNASFRNGVLSYIEARIPQSQLPTLRY